MSLGRYHVSALPFPPPSIPLYLNPLVQNESKSDDSESINSVLVEQHLFQTDAYHSLADWASSHPPIIWVDKYIIERFYLPTFSFPRQVARPVDDPKGDPICGSTRDPVRVPRTHLSDCNRRITIIDNEVNIYGWPSRGGVIVLEEATHVDFEWLGLNTVDPLSACDRDDDGIAADKEKHDAEAAAMAAMIEEDNFSQRLLLLGAKWWDSEARFRIISSAIAEDDEANEAVEEGMVEEPTLRERRWVKVGWEVTSHRRSVSRSSNTSSDSDESNESWEVQDNGLWVLSCDTTLCGILEEDNLVPHDADRVKLARSMEERCLILRDLGATYFPSLREYKEESTFLKAWEEQQVEE